MKQAGALILLLSLSALVVQAQKITKETVTSNDKKRIYYLFVPENLDPSKPLPMILMLHGSGHDGMSLVEKWRALATKERIILAGPDSLDSQNWNVPNDAPDFLYDVVEAVKAKYPVNPRRVYLFGHSGGAVMSFTVALMESQYFAAAAIHAGALRKNDNPLIDHAGRKIPISVYVGDEDPLFPLKDVRATRDLLNDHGFKVELTEIKNHNHDYYSRSDEINALAWAFVKGHELPEAPIFEHYDVKKR